MNGGPEEKTSILIGANRCTQAKNGKLRINYNVISAFMLKQQGNFFPSLLVCLAFGSISFPLHFDLTPSCGGAGKNCTVF